MDGAGCCSFQGARPPPQHVTKAAQVETGKQSAGRARQRCLMLLLLASSSSEVSSASLWSLFSPVFSTAATQRGGRRSGRSLQRRRESGGRQMSFLICTGGFGFLLWSTFGAVGGIVHMVCCLQRSDKRSENGQSEQIGGALNKPNVENGH